MNPQFGLDDFCGILVEWLSNIKESRIYLVEYAERKYIEDPLKSREIREESFVALLVMVNFAGKKVLVWCAEN